MNKIITLSLILVCFTLKPAHSQDTTAISSEKVEVIKSYQAAILQAKKKKIPVSRKEQTQTPIRYNYNVTTEKVIDFERPDPEIKALGYQGGPITNKDAKNGYIYGGYGNKASLNLGAAYHYYIEDWLDAGFKVDHFSAKDSVGLFGSSQGPLASYSNTEADAYLGYSLGTQTKIKLAGHSDFSRHRDYISFFDDSLSIIPVNRYGVDLGFSHNVFEDSGFVLRLGVGYESSKNKLDDFGDNGYKADINILKTISDKISVELPASYSRISPKDSLSEGLTSVGDLQLSPSIRYKGENYRAKVGLEYITGDEVNYIFPIIDIELNQVVEKFDLRLYTCSDYRRNSLYELSDIHPYYNSFTTDYSGYYHRAYNMMVSRMIGPLNTSLNFAYEIYDNDFNFVENLTRDVSRQNLEYVDREAFSIAPEIRYSLDDKVDIGLSGTYNIFLTDSLDLFYKPTFTLGLHGKERLVNDKLELTQDLVYNSRRMVSQEIIDGVLFDLDRFVDISLGVKYHISRTLSIYAKGTNLLGQEYFNWARQPLFRQQVWGGVKFRF